MNQEPETKTIKKAFYNLVLSTTCHGIPDLFRTDRTLLKIIWIIFLIVSTGACGWMITKSVTDYFEYDVITKIKIIQENEMVLPAVTLCVNRYNETILYKEINLMHCKFDSETNCLYEYQYYFYFNKACLTINNVKINSSEFFKINKGGISFGLEIAVYLPNSTYVSVLITDNQIKLGFNQLENLYATILSETNFKIKKYVDKKLPSPYNKCVATSDSPLYKEIVESNTTYTQEYCLTLCGCKYLTRVCNCSCPSLYEITEFSKLCSLNKCYQTELKRFNFTQKCNYLCSLECEKTNFEISAQSFQNSAEAIPQAFSDIIKRPLNLLNLSQNEQNYIVNRSFIVRIYYESLTYTETSQVPKTTFPDIVSIVGGTLGLFLGLSLLSFIEVFGFLIEAFLIKIKRVESNEKVNSSLDYIKYKIYRSSRIFYLL